MWNTLEYSSYLIDIDGGYCCPMCGHKQKLTPLKGDVTNQQPNFFRLVVRRSSEELEISKRIILYIAEQMLYMQNRPKMATAIPNYTSCVHPIFGACEFFSNHTYGLPVEHDPRFVRADTLAYVGEANGIT
jgi:hypothetical protein